VPPFRSRKLVLTREIIRCFLLKKVEELTLYLIEQNKKIESQGQEINELKKQISEMDH
jgi:hypothetical protein